MEGFILAAGLGTRLRPLTDHRPKALVEVDGRTLLDICIHRLADAGIRHIVVNVHHFGDMVIDYLHSRQWPCEVEVSDERVMLLDTGGALRKATPLFSGVDTVLVHNVDVLSKIDLRAVATKHESDGNLATLCVSHRHNKRSLIFDNSGRLVRRASEGEEGLAFSGISVVSPELFTLLLEADHPFPIIDEYIRLTATYRIGYFMHEAADWLDVGKPETLAEAQQWNLSSSK